MTKFKPVIITSCHRPVDITALLEERWGDAALRPALVGLRPEPNTRLGHSATIDYRGNSATVRPTITSRAVKPPLPRGHRTYLEVGK